MRPIQYFSQEYLEHCKEMGSQEILEFLESFRLLQEPKSKSKLISLKVPENLLDAFRRRCHLENVRYQTQLKRLMRNWLEGANQK